jgi:hypothetical protein
MAFELPDLDTRDSAALQAELIRRIPQFTTLWTDFNASDPGITLLQMLCWIGESLLYQANAIPLLARQNYLRQTLGLAFSDNVTPYSKAAALDNDYAFEALRLVLAQIEAGTPLTDADLQRAVLGYRDAPYLALTLDDVQALALQANRMIQTNWEQNQCPPPQPLQVKRADALARGEATQLYVLSDALWAYRLPSSGNIRAPDARGWWRCVLLLDPPIDAAAADAAKAESQLLDDVRRYVTPRVLLGNRVNVWAAQLTSINLRVELRCPPNVLPPVVLNAVLSALFAYFQPDGWSYDSAPVAESVQLLIESVPGVAALESLALDYTPTARLPDYAQLDVNALLADLPPGSPGPFYRGLPQLRCVELRAKVAA